MPIGQSWTNPSTLRYSVIIKPQAPIYDFSSLWYDGSDNSLYSFGGEESFLETKNLDLAVWKLQLNGGGGGTWSQNTTYGSPPFTQGITRPFGGTSTFTNSTGFYLGGYSSSHSSPQTQNQNDFVPLPGLVEYNFDSRTWTNSTAGTTTLSESGSFEWGGLEYVPFGPNGLLVIWGGETANNTIYFPGVESRLMNTVTLLDPVTKEWYTQAIPGTVPSARNRFCSVVATDPRPISTTNATGTSEIFMYGGYAGMLGTGAEQYDEVWVLSIPAFTWQRVDASQKSARIGHTCHLVGGRQLLSIGGVDAAQTDAWSTPDYSNLNGIGVFDLVANVWLGGYNASAAPYQRSQVLQNHYDQKCVTSPTCKALALLDHGVLIYYGESSGAYPQSWTQPKLANLIIQKATASTTVNSTAATASPFPTAINKHHGLSPGTSALIAGVTVGSTIGLLVPFLLIVLYLRRKAVAHDCTAKMHGEAKKNELDAPTWTPEMAAREVRGREQKAKQKFVVELEGGAVVNEIGGERSGRGTPAGKSRWGTPMPTSKRGLVKGESGRATPNSLEMMEPARKEGGYIGAGGESGYWKSEYFEEKVGGPHF